MATYQVTLEDGNLYTQTSKRVFTHAVICKQLWAGEFQGYYVKFAGSKELAEKAASAHLAKTSKNIRKGTTCKVVEVAVI